MDLSVLHRGIYGEGWCLHMHIAKEGSGLKTQTFDNFSFPAKPCRYCSRYIYPWEDEISTMWGCQCSAHTKCYYSALFRADELGALQCTSCTGSKCRSMFTNPASESYHSTNSHPNPTGWRAAVTDNQHLLLRLRTILILQLQF